MTVEQFVKKNKGKQILIDGIQRGKIVDSTFTTSTGRVLIKVLLINDNGETTPMLCNIDQIYLLDDVLPLPG